MRVNVCYVVSSLINEGPVKVLYNTLKYIDHDRLSVSVITLREEREGSLLSDFQQLNIQIIQLGIQSKLAKVPQIISSLKQKIGEVNPNIVHSHCPRSLVFLTLLSGDFIRVHTIHNFPGLVDRILYGNFKGGIVEILMKWALRRIDLPIACGGNLKQRMISELNIHTFSINNGVDFPINKPSSEEKVAMRKLLGLEPNKKIFVFVGRFSMEKDPLFLVDIFSRLFPEFELLMLGEGPLLAKIKKRSMPNIRLLGFKSNVRDYLISADYFVSSSETEGMPNSVLEAMSVGLPLLLSEIPAHQEIIEGADCLIGYLFKKNENDFKDKLVKLISFQDSELEDSVINVFESKYTAQLMSHSYQKTYFNLLNLV